MALPSSCLRRRVRSMRPSRAPPCAPYENRSSRLSSCTRVLRPGGVLRFNEHVISEHRAVGHIQRAADATVWPFLSGGCHLGRDTLVELQRAGFVIECCGRTSGIRAVGPPKSYVLGTARRIDEPT